MVNRGIVLLLQTGVTHSYFPKYSAPIKPLSEVKRLEPEISDLVPTLRISGAVNPLPYTSSWRAQGEHFAFHSQGRHFFPFYD